MKRIVLALVGLHAAVSSVVAGTGSDFGIGTNQSSLREPALMLRKPRDTTVSVLRIADPQAEERGSRPSIAYTIFRLDSKKAGVSLQPVLGRINGAQLYVSF